MNYMRKWPNLHLSCTAYAPRYFDPNLVRFMNTSAYRGRVLWGSDDPWFPMDRSLTEARALRAAGRGEEAETRFSEAAAVARTSRASNRLREVLREWADLRADRGDHRGAYELSSEALTVN